jgi:protein-S-isoprenylcysteine O-methyltransferase Ste14
MTLPGSSMVFETVYLAGLIAGGVIRSVYTRPYRKSPVLKKNSGRAGWVLLSAASLGFILPLIHILTRRLEFADWSLPLWSGWTGTALYAAAIWLLWRSHADLGRSWSPSMEIIEGQSLVTRGVYRRIRHPMYAAHWLWGAAQAMLINNWVAGPALLVAFIPLYFYRIPREEELLLAEFGEEYRRYMKRTGRLLPRRKTNRT